MGSNINGPSLIRAPRWLENPLWKYYLYFSHHYGKYIRLAYSDRLEGPWCIYEPGTLQLKESYFLHHIASPDVHLDEENFEIRMYYHGVVAKEGKESNLSRQKSRVATSKDGINFTSRLEVFGTNADDPRGSHLRVFRWNGYFYALGMHGMFFRSLDGLREFEQGPTLFTRNMRHLAVKLDGSLLSVFYSNVFDCPEAILMSTVELTPNWMEWKESKPVVVLEPETEYEGADRPLKPSERGEIQERARQIRDPAIFSEEGKTYLLYTVAGENGIAIAELIG